MGNRATVVFDIREPGYREQSDALPAVYLHWNGGPESVYGFADTVYRRFRGGRPGGDPQAFGARFVQAAADLFPDGLSVYLTATTRAALRDDPGRIDPGDNGVYVFGTDGVRRYVTDRWLTPDEVTHEEHATRDDPKRKEIADELVPPTPEGTP